MRVLVTGSRSWTDAKTIYEWMAQLPPGTTLMHGGADGADTIASRCARACIPDLDERIYKVYAQDRRRYGKYAFLRRNSLMVSMLHDLVLAFWDGQSRGTEDTIKKARRRGIPVKVIREEGHVSEATEEPQPEQEPQPEEPQPEEEQPEEDGKDEDGGEE